MIIPHSDEKRARRATRAYRALRGIKVPIDVIVSTRAEFDRFSGVRASLEAEILERGKKLYGRSARELVRSWLLKASHDLAAAQSLAEPERAILDVAIYLCQQAAEKALKGFLVFHDRRPPRTHDLRSLIAAAAEIDQCFSAWNDAAERLTPYATLYRYPGELVPKQAWFMVN